MGRKILVLAGPTAAGKTASSLAVAKRFGAEIISADAMQVYRGMDVGTAKVSLAERDVAPHHAIDVVDPDEDFDAAAFRDLADKVMTRAERVIVVGGTSLYIRALLRGLVPTPPVDPLLRQRLEALEEPHQRLAEVDPALAKRLHPNDRVRVVRGLEVFEATGRRLSELQAAHAAEPDRVHAVGLWLDRPDLRERLDRRLTVMVEHGYLEEVQALLDAGYSRELKPMLSLGYRHLSDHLHGDIPLTAALARTSRDTWNFARKQRNWMRQLAFPQISEGHETAALEAAELAFGGP